MKGSSQGGPRFITAAFLSGYIGLTAAALSAALMFGIQPLIASGPDGRPLYAPYPLSIAIPAMAIEHLLLFSIIEGVVTVMLMRYFLKHEPTLIYSMRKVSCEKV
jgi:cobalt/nickel transport system permease protein